MSLLALAPVPSDPAGQIAGDMVRLAPLVIISAWSLLLLLTDAFASATLRVFQRRLALVGVGLAASAALVMFGDPAFDSGKKVFFAFLVVDQFSLLIDLGVLLAVAAVLLFAGDFARSHKFEYGEQEALVLIAAAGMMMLGHANDLVTIFLGIETMSIAVYVMVGARWNSKRSSEAALKYFLMGAFASAVLLMGIALLYGALGTTRLDEVASNVAVVFTKWGGAQPWVEVLEKPGSLPNGVLAQAHDRAVAGMAPAALFVPGMLMLLAALLFKVGAVPLHMWVPDVYDGAPTPTTAFMASGVKLAGVAALLRVFVGCLHQGRLVNAPYGWVDAVALVALLSMTVGNLAAIRQSNVKRLLAYSSIAHVGYLLVGVVAAGNLYGHSMMGASLVAADQTKWAYATGDAAVSAVLYYTVTYAIATIGTFATVSWLGSQRREALRIDQWAGLASHHPGVALSMTVCVLSLMGLPPLAGFFGKLYVFRVAFENGNPALRYLVVAALVNSVIGAYYYLRLIVAMYLRPSLGEPETLPDSGAKHVVTLAAIATLVAGIAANQVFRATDLAARGFAYPHESDNKTKWVGELRSPGSVQPTDAEQP